MSTNPTRLYRTYTALGERLNGALEKVSITETELPETLLLQIGEGPTAEILVHRDTWKLLARVADSYSSEFTWVRDDPPITE